MDIKLYTYVDGTNNKIHRIIMFEVYFVRFWLSNFEKVIPKSFVFASDEMKHRKITRKMRRCKSRHILRERVALKYFIFEGKLGVCPVAVFFCIYDQPTISNHIKKFMHLAKGFNFVFTPRLFMIIFLGIQRKYFNSESNYCKTRLKIPKNNKRIPFHTRHVQSQHKFLHSPSQNSATFIKWNAPICKNLKFQKYKLEIFYSICMKVVESFQRVQINVYTQWSPQRL